MSVHPAPPDSSFACRLKVGLLRDGERIVDLDTEVADGALQFGVFEQQLHRPEVAGAAVVLSHDATFLKHLWDKTLGEPRIALTLADLRSQGMKITPGDLEKACQGRTANDIDDLLTYLASGAGVHIDIIRKMRVVLETYCRTTYSACFTATDWLGDIVRKIRQDGEDHPASALYDELDQINSYTSQYHHGEDLNDITPDDIDPHELTGFTKQTLRIVNALRA